MAYIINKLIKAVLFFAVFSYAPVMSASTIAIESSGQLIGFTGIIIGGEFYDVDFFDGNFLDLSIKPSLIMV